jgi:hypothetical protein
MRFSKGSLQQFWEIIHSLKRIGHREKIDELLIDARMLKKLLFGWTDPKL